MQSPRVYFNNIGSICTDSLRHGNGLSALLLLTRAAKSSGAKSSASKTRSMESRLKKEPLPELFPQTPVSSYYWLCRTQVADKVVSPSCFRSSLPSCPLSWCPLCHSFSTNVVFESGNVSRPSMYSLLITSMMSFTPV